mmetsp:Transcript_41954/g.104327  ORF Transcript_41954/g.104327 Transcript_41954/m.104327 type:complete len:374 (+) Transcript_41954:1671-2792(+)
MNAARQVREDAHVWLRLGGAAADVENIPVDGQPRPHIARLRWRFQHSFPTGSLCIGLAAVDGLVRGIRRKIQGLRLLVVYDMRLLPEARTPRKTNSGLVRLLVCGLRGLGCRVRLVRLFLPLIGRRLSRALCRILSINAAVLPPGRCGACLPRERCAAFLPRGDFLPRGAILPRERCDLLVLQRFRRVYRRRLLQHARSIPLLGSLLLQRGSLVRLLLKKHYGQLRAINPEGFRDDGTAHIMHFLVPFSLVVHKRQRIAPFPFHLPEFKLQLLALLFLFSQLPLACSFLLSFFVMLLGQVDQLLTQLFRFFLQLRGMFERSFSSTDVIREFLARGCIHLPSFLQCVLHGGNKLKEFHKPIILRSLLNAGDLPH